MLLATFPHYLSTSPSCTSTPLIPRFTSNRIGKNKYHENSKFITNSEGGSRQNCHSDHIMTCTSRTGYQGVCGGHVLTIQAHHTGNAYHLSTQQAWQAGKHDEDVLCACVDNARDDGCIFAGLSSGDVVVSLDASCLRDTLNADNQNTNSAQPIVKWLHTRPTTNNESDSRQVGQKFARSAANVKNKIGNSNINRDGGDDDADLNDYLF